MKHELPTFERVKSLLSYDPTSGELRWRVLRRGNAIPGSLAGSGNSKGYWKVSIDDKNFLSHRVAWLLANGAWPTRQIDHINRDKADNRLANLREVGPSENALNSALSASNKSGFRGVTWHKENSRWNAKATLNGKKYHLGYFDTRDEAHKAYVSFRTMAGTAHLGELAASQATRN